MEGTMSTGEIVFLVFTILCFLSFMAVLGWASWYSADQSALRRSEDQEGMKAAERGPMRRAS
jgi:hypothetical protein